MNGKEEQKKLQETSRETKRTRGEVTGSNRFMRVTVEFMMRYAALKNVV